MAAKIQAIRGMHDILPDQSPLWQFVEERVRTVLQGYGYSEIRLPVVEVTELFKRSIGEVTDIVEKEMYTFVDRNGDSLTLRPEGTAGCVRSCIEQGLIHNQTQRLWYQGQMFRHERPQKGRYRQFHQIGVEAFGLEGPDIDLELILMSGRIWRVLGLDGLELQINTLGTPEERSVYRGRLVEYLRRRIDQLDEDSRRRLETNPLRILDTKNPDMAAVVAGAPALLEDLGTKSRSHFEALCRGLDEAGIAYTLNPRLVRGLDYYAHTVFEWITDQLGAQGTLCAGGRYDGLVEQLGGRPTPATGFAMGLERLIALLDDRGGVPAPPPPDAYVVAVGDELQGRAMRLSERLRDEAPGLRLITHCGGGGFKSQFKKADRSGARFAIVLGEDEWNRGSAGVKPLRAEGMQEEIPLDRLAAFLTGAA